MPYGGAISERRILLSDSLDLRKAPRNQGNVSSVRDVSFGADSDFGGINNIRGAVLHW